MDSISENVVAMIAVVVGILIIGTALVPIVQHASSGTEKTETITGSNEYYEGNGLTMLITSSHTVTMDEGNMTIDNKATSEDVEIISNFFLITGSSAICKIEPIAITVYGDDNQMLRSGTVALTPSQAVITGLDYDDPNQSYSNTIALTNAALSSRDSATMVTLAPPTEIYAAMMTATIGDGQTALVIYGDPNDPTIAAITTNTQSSPDSAVTLTKNDNGTATITISDEAMMFAPIGWSQTVTTAGEVSEYAALYGIIPIMCILAMAYVLIRRF